MTNTLEDFPERRQVGLRAGSLAPKSGRIATDSSHYEHWNVNQRPDRGSPFTSHPVI